MQRRSFLIGLGLLCAPAVIRTPELLMPVKALKVPRYRWHVHSTGPFQKRPFQGTYVWWPNASWPRIVTDAEHSLG